MESQAEMTEERPSKKPRASLDKSRLSAADKLAFARVAELLNKPLYELYEESPTMSNVPEILQDDPRNMDGKFADPYVWTTPSKQLEILGDWQSNPENSEQIHSNVQANGTWTQSPVTDFVGHNFDEITFDLWAQDMSDKSHLQIGNINSTVDYETEQPRQSLGWSHLATVDEPWVSLPTSALVNAVVEVDPRSSIFENKFSAKIGDDRSFDQEEVISTSQKSEQNTVDLSLNSDLRSSLIGDVAADQDWIILNPEISSVSDKLHTRVSGINQSTISMPDSHITFDFEKADSKSSKSELKEYSANEVVSQRPQRHGPFQDQQLREETSTTRKLKACVRCRFQKIRCHIDNNNPSGSCQTCQDVSKQKIHTLPCVRYKLTECTLYRTGKAPGLEFTFRWPVMKLKDISEWSDSELRTIKVVSDVCPVPLELSVRRFIPNFKDSTQKTWMDGKVKKFKTTTPFAIANMSATVKTMREYIDRHVFQCMEFWLVGRDPLIQETYKFARQYMLVAPKEEAHLLAEFFRLWFAVRRTATTEFVAGDDLLDMTPETTDRSYPLFGKVPLPPVMIQQLDMILTLGFLQPLRKKVLEDFQKIVLNNKPRSWMAIYLVTFISLHSAATVTNESYQSARKHGLQRRFAMPNFISDRHHSANVFLTHYHYLTKPCNPFNIDWRKRQTTPFSGMTTNEIDFLLKTSEMVEERQAKFRRTRENNLYEDDLYFVSQLFNDDWEPVDTIIDYGDETIFGVPLKQSGSPKRSETN